VAEGGRIEPGTHARDPLHHAEHNAITDQAAQLLRDLPQLVAASFTGPRCDCHLCWWHRSALALLREVARG
jgi:hypothetical protein